jgi:DMSO/TMAO reductase YedYZ molybdopterin-dependent catalytic subunit
MDARRVALFSLIMIALLAGCTSGPASPTATPVPDAARTTPTPCAPAAIVVPTPPAEIPGYAELDPTTGLHMTGTASEVDLEAYRLQVTGMVDNPLSLSYDELRCLPKYTKRCTIVCPGFFQDEAVWSGASLQDVLDLAGVQKDATGLRLRGADGYGAIVFFSELTDEDNFLAYEWEGEPVPIIHGFPVRAVFPALNGNKWVKWLIEIEVF